MDEARTFWVTAAERYLEDCRVKASTVRAAEFAGRMRRTPVRLAREFHLSVGTRLKEFFSERQVEYAKELLRTTARGTAQIATDAGFGTPRTFYRVFRRRTGLSPTDYRREVPLADAESR
jgi:AraC family transcriptional regulator